MRYRNEKTYLFVEAQMNCSEFSNLIDSYLQGNLSEEKQEAFEMHYFECDRCYAQLKVAERLHSKEIPIILKGREAGSVFTRNRQWNWRPVLAAASVLVVVIVSVFIIRYSGRPELIFNISDFSAPVYIESETRGDQRDEMFAEAMGYYNRKEYSRSLEILKNLAAASPQQNPKVTFFKGICLLFTHEPGSAVKEFDIIIENMNPSYYDEAIYYKAVALLRLNKTKQALEQLRHLSGMFSPYAAKARALMAKAAGSRSR